MAIHAAKKPITKEIALFFQKHYPDWEILLNIANKNKGCIVAICHLVDCLEMNDALITQQTKLEIIFGNWQIGRYAWKLEKIQSVNTIPFSGNQGLKEVPHEVIKQINSV